jgi:transcriptional regulator with XRE-family HTH domain
MPELGQLPMHKPRLNLRPIRERKGLSVEAVAARLNLSPAQVSRIERAATDTTTRRLRQFAELYGVSVADLFQDQHPDAPAISVEIRGEIYTGHWAEDLAPLGVTVMPSIGVEREKLFALLCKEPAMDLVYPRNSMIFCLSFETLGRPPESGDHVVMVQRDGSGRVERQLRELRDDPKGRSWLWPRSSHPEYQQPVKFTTDIEVEAVVVASFIKRIREKDKPVLN